MTSSSLRLTDRVTPASAPYRFLVLDGLRGIAAFAVILDHVPTGALASLVPGRYLAVDFFFMLSGFVLTHAYGKRLAEGWSPLIFMYLRFVRLYPMYLAALILCLALAVLGALRGWKGPSAQDILILAPFALLFLPSPPVGQWGQGALYPFNGPCWSLFYELIANIVYACFARFLSLRVLAGFLIVSAICLAIATFRHDEPGVGWQWQAWDLGLSRVAFAFFTGVAIYHVREGVKLPGWPAPVAVLVFVAVLMLPATGAWRHIADLAATILVLPLIIAFGAGARVTGLAAVACAGLGALSYGVYVLQVPVLTYINVLLATLGGADLPVSAWSAILIAALTAVVAATLTVVFEKPLRSLLTRGLKLLKQHQGFRAR